MKKLALSLLLVAGQAYAATEGSFVVHEWGTFTSVQGSDGLVQGGMNHEETSLPSFVIGRDVLSENFHKQCHFSKSMPVCEDEVMAPVIHNQDVTQKMETPVIYFHSDRERQAIVRVSFPKGIISQYFPEPVVYYPHIGNASALANGYTQYNVNVLMSPVALPDVEPTSVYAPARQVSANFVSSGSQNEKFIFYRGLGSFQNEVHVTSYSGGLTVNNLTSNYVPAVFLIDVAPNGVGAVRRLGVLQGQSTLSLSAGELRAFRDAKLPQEYFLTKASQLLKESLQQAGMNQDEAAAMTNTWKNSYFRNPGLRVLYVLSRAETDALLPLTIEPQPTEIQRALVGRIELMLDTEEAAMLTALQKNELSPAMLGRFAEPKLRRLLQLTRDTAQQASLRAMIASLQH